MPSTSKTQQRLMGVAYSVKKGDTKINDVDAEYRDKVADLVDGMTLKQLKDFASTEHKGLPEVKENTTPASMHGMGSVAFPVGFGDQTTAVGSGDVPAGKKDEDDEDEYKKKKNSFIKSFEQFVTESYKGSKDSLIDILVNSMEYMEQDEFLDLGIDFGYEVDDLIPIYNDYWEVDAKDRMKWDNPEWTKWLKGYGIR